MAETDALSNAVKVTIGVGECLEQHARDCCEWVSGIALHPSDFERLGIAEIWGLPVLAWERVTPGRLEILCDGRGVLTPQFDHVDDLLGHWENGLRRPASRE